MSGKTGLSGKTWISGKSKKEGVGCKCCSHCKERIQKLEDRMQLLMTTMKDYLPDNMTNYLTAQPPPTKSKPKSQKPVSTFSRVKPGQKPSSLQVRQNMKPLQKQVIVKRIDEAMNDGDRLKDICHRLGVSEHNYLEWKKEVEQAQQMQNEDDDLIIFNCDT